jgi:hypothetical protein
MSDDSPVKTVGSPKARERLVATLEAAAPLKGNPSDQPPPVWFSGETDDWFWRVVVFRFAGQMAISTDLYSEFSATACDPFFADNFETHFEIYEKEIRRWAFSELPSNIQKWVEDEQASCDSVFNRRRRFEYILNRQLTIDWWKICGRLPKTDEMLNTSASQFMKMLPFFNIAANEINDVEFFKKIVRARAQRAAIAFEASHFIRCFWMSWSLWNLSHTERAAVINRRSGLPAFESSTLRKAGYSQYQKPIYSSSSFRPFGFLYSAPRLSEAQRRIWGNIHKIVQHLLLTGGFQKK